MILFPTYLQPQQIQIQRKIPGENWLEKLKGFCKIYSAMKTNKTGVLIDIQVVQFEVLRNQKLSFLILGLLLLVLLLLFFFWRSSRKWKKYFEHPLSFSSFLSSFFSFDCAFQDAAHNFFFNFYAFIVFWYHFLAFHSLLTKSD